MMKEFKILQNYQHVTQRNRRSKCYWQSGTNTLAGCRVATNLQFVEQSMCKVQQCMLVNNFHSIRNKQRLHHRLEGKQSNVLVGNLCMFLIK